MKLLIKESSRDDYIRIPVPSKRATQYLKNDPECKNYYKQLNRETVGEVLIDSKTKEQIGHAFVYHSGENKGFIFNINVSEKFRGMGFGKILLNDCVKRFGGIDLTVSKDNKRALNMYLNYGFVIIDSVNDDEEYYMKYEG